MRWWSWLSCGSQSHRKVAPDPLQAFIMEAIKMDVPEALKSIVSVSSNTTCADCGSSDTEWASLGFGTLICLKCAGFHRSLGTHITAVRAIKLDSWSPAQVTILELGGNAAFHEHCAASGLDPETVLTMKKYASTRVLYYSALLKSKVAKQPEPPFNENDWADTASYALQASTNFVSNVQETDLNHNGSEPSPKKSPTRPANWVADNATTSCMECGAAFTFLFRRHHCRRCGRTVCGHCAPANNDRPIPEWGYPDPVRHCKKCYKSPAVDWK